MANFCSIIKDAPYQRLRGILGAEEAARVLDRNNGYDLMYSPTGEESPIWRSLITRFNGDEVKTSIATSYFYTDDYLELNDWITALKEKEYKDRKYEEGLLEILSKAPRNTEGKLLAPNGKVSNLTERQYAQVRTELFKNWFGDWERVAANFLGESTGNVDIADIINADGSINFKVLEEITDEYFNNADEILFNKGRKTLRQRAEKHYDGNGNLIENNTLEHLQNVTKSALASNIRSDLKPQLVLAAALHDLAKPFHGGQIHGFQSLDLVNKLFKGNISPLVKFAIRHHMLTTEDNKKFSIDDATRIMQEALDNNLDLDDAIEILLAINTADILSGQPEDSIDFYSKKSKKDTINEEISFKKSLLIQAKNKLTTASKVVDENGEPLVVYHNSSAKFNTFDISLAKTPGDIYFTQSKAISDSNRYGENIYPVFLNIKDLYDTRTADFSHMEKSDGAFDPHHQGTYIVHNPNQIKSATHNNGDFSVANNNIEYRIDNIEIPDFSIETTTFNFLRDSLRKAGIDIITDERQIAQELGIDPYDLEGITPFNTPGVLKYSDLEAMHTSKKIYGFSKGNKIYLTKEGMDYNTPIHEYTHLWAKSMMINNPKAWSNIVEQLRSTDEWNKVINDPNYSSISEDENLIASEVLARISGTLGSELIMKETANSINNMATSLKSLWNWVSDLFNIDSFDNIDSITSRILYDLLSGTDLKFKSNVPEIKIDYTIINGSSSPYTSWKWQNLKLYPIKGKMIVPFDPFNPFGKLFENTPLGIEINDAITPDDMITFMFGEDIDGNPILYKSPLSWKATKLLSDLLDIGYTTSSIRSIIKSKKDQRLFLSLLANSFFNHGLLDVYDYIDALLKVQYSKFNELKEFKIASYTPSIYDGTIDYKDSKIKVFLTDSNYQYDNQYFALSNKIKKDIGLLDDANNGSFGLHGTSFSLPVHTISGESLPKEEIMNNFLALIATAKLNPNNTFIIIEPDYEVLGLSREDLAEIIGSLDTLPNNIQLELSLVDENPILSKPITRNRFSYKRAAGDQDKSIEVSSAGDKSYSAQTASLKEGTKVTLTKYNGEEVIVTIGQYSTTTKKGTTKSSTSIENIYQHGFKENIWSGEVSGNKVEKPTEDSIAYCGEGIPKTIAELHSYINYLRLWLEWAKLNPNKIKDLLEKKESILTDKYAKTSVTQARALAEIANNSAIVDKDGKKYLVIFDQVYELGVGTYKTITNLSVLIEAHKQLGNLTYFYKGDKKYYITVTPNKKEVLDVKDALGGNVIDDNRVLSDSEITSLGIEKLIIRKSKIIPHIVLENTIDIMMPFNLTQEQEESVNAITAFMESSGEERIMTLQGFAGTGKSTVMGAVRKFIEAKNDFYTDYGLPFRAPNVLWAATTHSAALNLSKALNGLPVITLLSAMGSKPSRRVQNDFEVPEKAFKNTRMPIANCDIIVIDEASMVSAQALEDLRKWMLHNPKLKVLFIGDPALLPPVNGGGHIPAFEIEAKGVLLTKVMRAGSGNPVIDESMHIRERGTFSENTTIRNKKGVLFVNNNGFSEGLTNCIQVYADSIKQVGGVPNPYFFKVLAYTNANVGKLNNTVRNLLFGLDARIPFLIGDVITAHVNGNGLINAANYVVTKVSDPITTTLTELTSKMPDNDIVLNDTTPIKGYNVILYNPISKDYTEKFFTAEPLPTAVVTAINNIELGILDAWKLSNMVQYYKLQSFLGKLSSTLCAKKSLFDNNSINKFQGAWDYGYASTVHKAQGSTYDHVFIDTSDFNRCTNIDEKHALLYTAITRASQSATILDVKGSSTVDSEVYKNSNTGQVLEDTIPIKLNSNLLALEDFLNNQMSNEDPGIIINPYTPKSSLGIADEYKSKQASRSYHQLTTPMKFGIDVALYLYLKENNLEKEDPKIELLERALLDCNPIAIKYMDQCLAGLQRLLGQLELRGVWFYRTPNGLYAMDNKDHFDIERMVGGLDLSLELFELEQDFNISAFLPVKESKYKPAEIIAPDIHQFNLLRQIGNTTLDDFRHKIQNKVNKLYNSPNVEENKSLGEGIIVRESDKTFSIVFVEDFTNIDSKEYGDVLDDIEIDDDGYRITSKGDRMYKLPINSPQVLVRRTGKSQEDFYETIFIKVDPTNESSKKDAKLIVEDILRTNDDIVTAQALLTKPTKGNDVIANSGILFASELSKLCADYSTLKEFITPVYAENIEDLRQKLNTQYFDRIDEYIELEAQQLYASFRLALHVVSTRLPSQALASIQDAMVVAFNKSNINNAFVTRWLLWLQGSDLDIDKTFLLNYNTDKHGKLYHWSRIANYRTDRLTDLSMKLPLPSGREIIWNNTGIRSNKVTIATNSMETPTGETPVDLSKDLELYALIDKNPLLVANQLKIAGNLEELEDLCRLTLEIRMLNKIGSHNFVYGFNTIDAECARRLINKLNKHNLTKTSEKARQNFNTANIRNIISSRALALLAFETVDQALIPFKQALKKIKGGTLYRPDDGSWIARLDKINSSGKTGVGPCANGLKTYFGNTFVANNFYNDQPTIEEIRESPVFFLKTFELKTVIDGNPLLRERRTFASMTDTMLSTAQLGILKSLYLELDSTQANLSPLFLSRANLSNLFSGLLTLAVDNAKELALGKLNASLNLICIHVALASLGYDATEIAAITTSPAFYKLVEEASGRFITDNGEKLDDGRPTKSMFDKLIANAESEAEEHDFIEIKRLYELGAEITQEALLFGINLGVTGNIKDIENKKRHLTGALRKRLKWFDTKDIIDEKGHISEACIDLLTQEAGIDTIEYQRFLVKKIQEANKLIDSNQIHLLDNSGKIADIDAVRFFNDENYKTAIIAIYDVFKAGVNIYHSLDQLQHYSGMFNAFVEGIEHLKTHSDSYRFVTDEAPKKYNNLLIDNRELKDDIVQSYMSNDEAMAEQMAMEYEILADAWGDAPASSYDSEFQLKVRFTVPSEYGEQQIAAATLLYNQKMFVEFLKNHGSEYEFTYKDPYSDPKKPTSIHISYKNNKDIIKFLSFMREVFIGLTDPENSYADTEFVNLFTPYETNLILEDNPLMLYLPYQRLAKIFADDGNASLKSKLLTLLQLLGAKKIKDLCHYLKVDSDITFGDLFNIYANIVDTSMTGGLFDLEGFKNQLLVDDTKSAILMLQVRSNFNNGQIKVSIDPHVLMAFMVSSQVRKLKKNRIIRFSDGFKEINLDNTLLLLLDEATHDSITMDQTIGLMNAIKLGDGAGIVVNVKEITLEKDGSLISTQQPGEPVTFTIEVTLQGRTYEFKQLPRVVESIVERPDPDNPGKTEKSIKRELKYETVTRNNVFPEMIHTISVLKDSGESTVDSSSTYEALSKKVTMDEVLHNITTNEGLAPTEYKEAMKGIKVSKRTIFEGIARNLRALGIEVTIVDEDQLPPELLGKNIRGANKGGAITLVVSEDPYKGASKGTIVHELLHSVFAVLKAKDFKKYKETLRILSKYTLHTKNKKGDTYYDFVVAHPEYKNMMESDIAEEAFLQLLEDIFAKESIDKDDDLTVDDKHLFEVIQEVLADPIQETFGIKQVPNIIDFLKTSITELPNLFPSELWLPEKISSNGYLANKIKISKMLGILNWVAKKVEEGVINKKC